MAASSDPQPAQSRTRQEVRLEEVLGVSFKDIELLRLALTHRSYAFEHGNGPDNERLEFLGDSVLGVIVSIHLFNAYPKESEGRLTKLRSSSVSTTALAKIGMDLNIVQYLHLGMGERKAEAYPPRFYANTIEAIIGAYYLDQGFTATTTFVLRLLGDTIKDVGHRGVSLDWKTSLQELAAASHLPPPHYTMEATGPDHQRMFRATVSINNHTYGTGMGRTKKLAQHDAAKAAWQALQEKD